MQSLWDSQTYFISCSQHKRTMSSTQHSLHTLCLIIGCVLQPVGAWQRRVWQTSPFTSGSPVVRTDAITGLCQEHWGYFFSRSFHRCYCANRLSGSSQSAGLEARIRILHGECALSEASYWNRHHYPEDISWRTSHLSSPWAALPSTRVWPAPHAPDTHGKTRLQNFFLAFFYFSDYFINLSFMLFSINHNKQR